MQGIASLIDLYSQFTPEQFNTGIQRLQQVRGIFSGMGGINSMSGANNFGRMYQGNTPMQSSGSLIDQTTRTITNSTTGQTASVLANDPRLQGMTDDEIFSQYFTPPSDPSDDYYTKNIMGSGIVNAGLSNPNIGNV